MGINHFMKTATTNMNISFYSEVHGDIETREEINLILLSICSLIPYSEEVCILYWKVFMQFLNMATRGQ